MTNTERIKISFRDNLFTSLNASRSQVLSLSLTLFILVVRYYSASPRAPLDALLRRSASNNRDEMGRFPQKGKSNLSDNNYLDVRLAAVLLV